MADENDLISRLRSMEDNVPDWNKLNHKDKNSYLCLSLLCEGCPLKNSDIDDSNKCRGKDHIYEYISNLSYNKSLNDKIRELEELIKSTESQEDIVHYRNRINSYKKIVRTNMENCSRILNNSLMREIDISMIPEAPKSDEKVPKKKGRVWTEEQKVRAVEARRKTWEAKKRAAQMKEAKEVPAAVVKEEPKSEQPDRLDIARAIIDKRLEMAQDKVNSIEDKIQSLKDEGVELECVMPDFGRNELTHDMKVLEEALEIIKKYLEL